MISFYFFSFPMPAECNEHMFYSTKEESSVHSVCLLNSIVFTEEQLRSVFM